MVLDNVVRVLFDEPSDRSYPITCEECSHSVEDPTAWKRETYTGYGTTVVDICPHCDKAVKKYYRSN
jgi:hypothetical protein